MLWCEAARPDARAIEQLGVFASQLAALGLPVGVAVGSVPGGLNRNIRFDLAPRLVGGLPAEADRIVLIGAEALGDARLVALRRLAGEGSRAAIAFGRFESRQAMIGLRAKLSYVFGTDPEVVDLGERSSAPFDSDAPVFGAAPAARRLPAPRPRLLVAGPTLDDPRQVAALSALAVSRQFELAVLTDGEAKRAWLAARGTSLPVYNYGEMLPIDLAARVDILACFGPLPTNYRLQCLVANLAVAGTALLDCSPDHAVAGVSDAFIRAPIDLVGLGAFVTADIVPNLAALAAQTRESTFARGLSGNSYAALLGSAPVAPASRRAAAPERARVVFMPTNGVGLGHAQRCTLVAATLDRRRTEAAFAAFPSCTGLIKGYGFDVMPMIPRSPLHARSYENDLANYVRLKAMTTGARTLVFDGGYVFDSVYRTIVENRLAGVWLRRGLWQAEQDNTTALDRGKVFDRVIVPTEAFDELNDPPTHGDGLHRVGPIVQRPDVPAAERARLRAALAERYGLAFERLVVTQLGAGVAADRGAQIQAVCGMMERRPDVLHLVLVWPTATLQPAWFAWGRTRVVRTRHAGVLAACADLCISAAGYNSFHEILYGALPAILIPQTGAFMDDQAARARAARDRELAAFVQPHEMMGLDRAIVRLLDEGEGADLRRRLKAHPLPEPGNAHAGALIDEVTHGDALERPALADRSARRR